MKLQLLSATALALASHALLSQTASAQSFDAVRLQRTAPNQDLGIAGAVVLSSPSYSGSDQQRTRALPTLDYQWASGWFAGVSNGIGINLSPDARMQYGLRLTADLGRKERRDDALRGMGDISAKPEVGVFLNLTLADGLQATTSLRYGSGTGGRGLVADTGLNYRTQLAPSWSLRAGIGLTVVNARHMQTFFGVTDVQSSRTGHAVYTPGAGLRDTRASLSLTHALNPRSAVTAVAAFNRLLDDAADSPLARDRDGAAAVLAYTYAF